MSVSVHMKNSFALTSSTPLPVASCVSSNSCCREAISSARVIVFGLPVSLIPKDSHNRCVHTNIAQSFDPSTC